jgi:hypothetical protein
MRVIVYDATDNTLVGLSWKATAPLMVAAGVVDLRIPVVSWGHLVARLEALRGVTQVQFWGHGSPGKAYVQNAGIGPFVDMDAAADIRKALAPGALWWWRTCASFAGAQGHRFAVSWARALSCRVAGSTFNIGFPWHSGVHSVVPGQTPAWSTGEGMKDGRTLWSTPRAPNTLPTWAMEIPEDW